MKIAKNGTSIDELPVFSALLQGVYQGLRGQGVPDATTNEAQRQEVHVEQRGGRIIPENKEGNVRSTGARDANGKGNDVAKKEEERDTADKIFKIRIGNEGSPGYDEIMNQSFLDDLESLRRRSDPQESTNRGTSASPRSLSMGLKGRLENNVSNILYTIERQGTDAGRINQRITRSHRIETCKGGVHHGTSLEKTRTNADHAQIAGQRIINGGLHDVQASHEKSGICVR